MSIYVMKEVRSGIKSKTCMTLLFDGYSILFSLECGSYEYALDINYFFLGNRCQTNMY